MITLLGEIHEMGMIPSAPRPNLHCRVFEDNSGALEIATAPKMRPRTKYLNVKYHHFRDQIDNGRLSIHAIDTNDQQADLFTKPVNKELFLKFRQLIMGW